MNEASSYPKHDVIFHGGFHCPLAIVRIEISKGFI